ncbi:MAG: TlyA family rRNA (cytidine-2'-O)-methyltransferase, partial [Thermodesulfatator sp.]
ALIMSGAVLVNGRSITKVGHLVKPDEDIILKDKGCPYVSRAGLKLEAALRHFNVCVKNKICLDVGASTGGFTDCLLRQGARLVYAVDVGYGQLDWKLRNRPDVVNLEKTNIKNLSRNVFQHIPDLATIDTSFISLKKVIPKVIKLLDHRADLIALIKPQFEAGRKKVGKGGVIRDTAVHEEVLSDLKDFFTEEAGLLCEGIIQSPIFGAKGNREFLVHLKKQFPLQDDKEL